MRHMDTLIGRIVETTEELGIADRTLILFTGDNGTHGSIRSTLEDRVVQGGKGKTTDAGTRVPLVAYWPGVVPEGRVSDDLVDFSDFMPTLLEASGTAPPEDLDGQSFRNYAARSAIRGNGSTVTTVPDRSARGPCGSFATSGGNCMATAGSWMLKAIRWKGNPWKTLIAIRLLAPLGTSFKPPCNLCRPKVGHC